MKRILKIAGLVVAFAVFSLAVLVAATFMGRKPIDDAFQVDGIRVLKDGFVTVGVVPTGDNAVALVDAGNDKSGKAILNDLALRNLGPEAVKAILLTHGHADHTAGVRLFPNAEIMVLAEDIALTEGREGGRGPLQRLMPVRPTGITVTRALKDGETLQLGGAIVRVYAVPGHTAGSAAFLVGDVLFLGDSADASKDEKLTGAPWLFSESQSQNRESLNRLARRLLDDGTKVKATVFSHSGALVKGLAPLTAFSQKN